MAAQVESFDVFDTVLTRAVGSPLAVFGALGRQLRDAGDVTDAAAFAAARRQAEVDAYRSAKAAGREVRLAEIYAQLGATLGWDDVARDAVLRRELDLEVQLLRPVPAGVRAVAQARGRGARVAFVSDTPWSADALREPLRAHGVWAAGDLVLTSADAGVNKADGALYRRLAEQAAVAPQEIRHRGNRADHDVTAARGVGLRAEWCPRGNPTAREAELERHGGGAGLTAAFAGAARLARLHVTTDDPHAAAVRDLAADVVAPVLVGYVLWILREAERRAIDGLWFLARDGQILLDIAQRLAPRLGVAVPCRYLYASRQGWNLPAVAAGAHADLAWIWDQTDDLSVRALLARLGQEPEAFAAELVALGLHAAAWDRPLDEAERARLRPWVAGARVGAAVRATAGRAQAHLVRYLDAQGLLAAQRPAIVEVVGHGNLQESLSAVTDRRGAPRPECFYFAQIHDGRQREMQAPVVYLEPESPAAARGLFPGFGVVALEAFCAADHGTLLGFDERDGGIVPRLAPANAPVVEWGLGVLQRTVAAFCDALLLDRTLIDVTADVRAPVLAVLREMLLAPTGAEARALGRFPWEDGHGELAQHRQLAAPHGWGDMLAALRHGALPRPHRAGWRAGALAVTPPLRRWLLQRAVGVGRRLRRGD
ncbi:MAG: hypothetical protein AAF628_30255 [Planctomycetota bacterium]